MSNKDMRPLLGSLEKDVFFLAGNVAVGSDGYVISTDIKGVTCTYVGNQPGTYVFTITNPGYKMLFTSLEVEAATGVDLVAQRKSATTSTVTYRLNTGATATTPSAACTLSFLAVIRNSSLNR